MADGFLGRWAQRKQAVREGKQLEEPAPAAVEPGERLASQPPGQGLRQAQPERTDIAPQDAPVAEPPPTLQDTQALTPQSDFKRYMAADVDPEVKNAAMKKLFTDPHFNVMDRLDTYIDDYSIPDPLPQSMLRQMASAKFLKLFDEEDEKDKQPGAGVTPSPASAAQTDNPATAAASPELPPPAVTAHLNDQDHADPDLRLQQDHAAGPQGSGRGPE
ncbi:MAG: DUF3306 domain-containing protein [Hylemonella sp.]|nr:DUF3306 domain-containing protein [Hylemonella sp.]